MGCSLNQRTAEFSLCNTLVLLLDLAFKQFNSWKVPVANRAGAALFMFSAVFRFRLHH